MKKKNALLTSGLCLGLSAVLLAGTTFAWFTDSVSNTGNRIQAGSLQVALMKEDTSETATYPYTDISNGVGDIFDGDVLWEPGMTQVAYLAVENQGTLALEYDFLLNVSDDAKGLSGVLEYKIVDDAGREAGWTNWADVPGEAKQMTNGLNLADLDNVLEFGVNKAFALVVHMDENAGNQYQGAKTIIDVQVQARQTPAEPDGFGNVNYDQDAQGAYADEVKAKAALNSDSADDVVVASNMTLTDGRDKVNIIADKYVNLSGTTITLQKNTSFALGQRYNSQLAPVTAVVENGNFVTESRNANVFVGSGSTVTFRNCSFTAVGEASQVLNLYTASDDITVVFENCTFDGGIILKGAPGYSTTAAFNGCTFPEGGLGSILSIGSNVNAAITVDGEAING